jgi:hypothetical protein
MNTREMRLHHDLYKGPCVLITLADELNRQMFWSVLDAIETESGSRGGASRDKHWTALEDRIRGASSWSSVIPPFERAPKPEERAAWLESVQTFESILAKRPYTSYIVDGIQYAVDVFNPRNELGLSYVGAGEPVLMLLLGESTMDPRQQFQVLPIRDRLGEIESFYRIVSRLVELLDPNDVCGGAHLSRVVQAYHSGGLSPNTRPWDLLWTLSSVRPEEIAGIPEAQLRSAFSKIIDVGMPRRKLFQVVPRFDSVMSREYATAARLLGRVAVTEVGDGAARPSGASIH